MRAKWFVLAAALVLAFGQLAVAGSSNPELKIVSGGTTLIVTPLVLNSGQVVYSNPNFNGWDISVVFGASNSPNLSGPPGQFGLDITSLTATCSGGGACSANPLDLFLSDVNFTQAVGANGLVNSYSTTSGVGSTTQTLFLDTGNSFFGGVACSTVGPLTGATGGSIAGGCGAAGPSAYSLTLEDIFSANASGVGSFSADGNVSAVPEPASLSLFGTGLLALGGAVRKKLMA